MQPWFTRDSLMRNYLKYRRYKLSDKKAKINVTALITTRPSAILTVSKLQDWIFTMWTRNKHVKITSYISSFLFSSSVLRKDHSHLQFHLSSHLPGLFLRGEVGISSFLNHFQSLPLCSQYIFKEQKELPQLPYTCKKPTHNYNCTT